MNKIIKMVIRRQLFLLSSSQVQGFEYLQHQKNDIIAFLNKNKVKEVLFVPYALNDHQQYTEKVGTALNEFGYKTIGIHTFNDPVQAIATAQCIFIGGGNTFLLLKTLYDNNLIDIIRNRCLNDGIPYMGSSAGTNVSTINIKTTNDMPIIYPPTFDALKLVPFNINPHYLDADSTSTHKGESRETRINEFHQLNTTPVLGLREGTCLLIENNTITLLGSFNARLFKRNEEPIEFLPNSNLSFLLDETD